eukprot:3834767-Prymnesium_polylepis.1
MSVGSCSWCELRRPDVQRVSTHALYLDVSTHCGLIDNTVLHTQHTVVSTETYTYKRTGTAHWPLPHSTATRDARGESGVVAEHAAWCMLMLHGSAWVAPSLVVMR